MEKRSPDAESGLLAYVGLLLGMFSIGAVAQQRSVVEGLWVTEAVAIALPAFFRLSLAPVRWGPWLGFRPISWKQALIAVVVSAANQPIVSLLTWIAHSGLPAQWVNFFDEKQKMLDTVFAAHAVPMVITVTLAAPLGEELFFRG